MRKTSLMVSFIAAALLATMPLASATDTSQNWFVKSAGMTDVELGGYIAFDVSGGQVTMEVEEVMNYSSSTTSGTLYLTLWITEDATPEGNGHEIAEVSLGELGPGQYFYDVVKTTDYIPPSESGTYYVHLLLTEYPNMDSFIDSVTFSGTHYLSGGSSSDDGDDDSGGGALHPLLLFLLLGSVATRLRRSGRRL